MTRLLRILVVLLPWRLKRFMLVRVFGYEIHPTARIGLAWVFPRHLSMGPHSRIDHLNVAIYLDRIRIGQNSSVGRRNWITGFPTQTVSEHFAHQPDRVPELVIGDHAAVTKNHHLDCTHALHIGDFSTVAGYHSQFLTHSIDLEKNRQSSAPIKIGNHCFVGTKVVVLGGASLPDRSVLGACALLTTDQKQSDHLYTGIPATPTKKLSDDLAYFHRTTGYVK